MPLDLRSFEPASASAAPIPGTARAGSDYEGYFGLAQSPFTITPDPSFLFWSASHDTAFKELLDAISRGDGFIVFTGDYGTGKTTICRAVLEHLDRFTFSALILNPFVTEEELLRTILQDFGVASREDVRRGRLGSASRQDLIDALNDFLLSLIPINARAVLFVDDAQNLPVQVLEQLRVLSNLETNTRKLLQIVLVGQTELEHVLQSPQIRQLNQRVSIRCRLQPLSREEVRAYIDHRLAIARSPGAIVFPRGTVALVHKISKGVPRVINLLCDRALKTAHQGQTTRIGPTFILRAAEALGLQPVRTGFSRWVRDRAALWL